MPSAQSLVSSDQAQWKPAYQRLDLSCSPCMHQMLIALPAIMSIPANVAAGSISKNAPTLFYQPAHTSPIREGLSRGSISLLLERRLCCRSGQTAGGPPPPPPPYGKKECHPNNMVLGGG